ncbi:serine/threonine-protein phosphatase Pgam5, mitochondrial [Scaptodrosophila lebanonensis]|uniref:Serine/threonine-protein phosphatase PGAM5, mitochondrial n=1 Tax=Drosophila lebanonensis TaxID=7225 RepID=A0A6J2UJ35_DROLE|nr:serine/threonine-protein phosphatase Pgam5, mitochondrial [Scaptodrosophila lebanonensis]
MWSTTHKLERMASQQYQFIWRTVAAISSGSFITYCTMKLCNSSNAGDMRTVKGQVHDIGGGGDGSELSQIGNGAWAHDWDCRAPMTVQPVSEDQQQESDDTKSMPVALRHIVLVRHGEYVDFSDGSHHLTDRGRLQAKLTGQRLHDMGVPWDHVVASTMTRAQETAMIILKEINFDPLKMKRCELLPEGTPCPGDPPQHRSVRRVQESFRRDGPRIEAAFRRYFFRASPEQKQDSYLLVIGHANVIRYLVCRALQFPPEAWTRISLKHGSITWLTVWPSGYVTVKCLGDSGFMPVEQLTSRRPQIKAPQDQQQPKDLHMIENV